MNRLKTLIVVITLFFAVCPRAKAAGPVITDSIAPSNDLNLPFGALAIGQRSLEQTLTLSNTGSGPLTLRPFTLTGSGAAAFQLNVNGGTAPCGPAPTLSAGQSCSVTLSFNPDLAGARTAFLVIDTQEDRIAFHDPATNGISLYELTSKTVIPVTTPPQGGVDDYPTWSPGSSQIAFHRQVHGIDAVYRVNLDGTGETFVANRATEPDWSPDGQKIAMQDTQNGGIAILNLNLNALDFFGSVGSGERSSPSWSNDNKKLVFGRISIFGSPSELHTMDDDGLNESPMGMQGVAPAWSPDGQSIAFHNVASQELRRVSVGPPPGSPTPLTTPTSSADTNPSWSPDGGSLVFQRSTSGPPMQDQLMKMLVNGSPAPLPLTSGGNVFGKTPAWSPATEVSVTLTGTALAAGSNSPPTAPQLVSPTDGQTGVATNITLKWLTSGDPDGDALTYELLLCTFAQFQTPSCAPTTVAKSSSAYPPFSKIGFAGSGLLIFGFFFGIKKTRRRNTKAGISILFLAALFLLAQGCGGGGDGNGNTDTGTAGTTGGVETSASPPNPLSPDTTYLWQITAKDGRGGETSSVVWRFTTGP